MASPRVGTLDRVKIDVQIAAVRASQGTHPIERQMLDEAFVGPPAPTTSPGVNATKQLELTGGTIVFHKPFSGVHVANAVAYGQTDETPPLHEAVSWRLAVALGPPWDEIVVPCVLREYAGEDGSLSLRATGWPRDSAPTLNPTWCLPAAPPLKPAESTRTSRSSIPRRPSAGGRPNLLDRWSA